MKTPLRVDAGALSYPRQIIDKGKTIITAGSSTDQAYLLLDGSARASGPIIREGDFQAGHFLSFVSFLALDAYEADVLATSRAEVLVLPRDLLAKSWQEEDTASWVFACSLASDAIKKKLAPQMEVA